MSYDNIAQPWSAPNNAPTKRIPKRGKGLWRYMHHPKSWVLYIFPQAGKKADKPIFIPKLRKFWETPGVNGVGGTQDNPDTRMARLQFTDQGFTILDPQNFDYLRVYPAIGKDLVVTKWTKLENLGGTVVTSSNDLEFAKWRLSLVAEKHLKPPHKQILMLMIRKQQELINMHDSKPHIPSSVGASTQARKKLEAMQDALLGLQKHGLKYYE